MYVYIYTYIYTNRYSCPIWLYNAILGYFMLFLRYLMFFFWSQDSGYETSYKNKHGWSFLIMQMGRSIKYSPMELKQLPFGGLTLMDQTTPKKLSPVFIAEPFFAPKFGWTSSSFREDVLRMTRLIRCAWIFEMYQNSWSPNPWFQYVRCINSWCFVLVLLP